MKRRCMSVDDPGVPGSVVLPTSKPAAHCDAIESTRSRRMLLSSAVDGQQAGSHCFVRGESRLPGSWLRVVAGAHLFAGGWAGGEDEAWF